MSLCLQDAFTICEIPSRDHEVYVCCKHMPVVCCEGDACRPETPEEAALRHQLPEGQRDLGYKVPKVPALPCGWQVTEYRCKMPGVEDDSVYCGMVGGGNPCST